MKWLWWERVGFTKKKLLFFWILSKLTLFLCCEWICASSDLLLDWMTYGILNTCASCLHSWQAYVSPFWICFAQIRNIQHRGDWQTRSSGLDWIGFTSGYRVSTALRIVYWPSLSLLGWGASRSVRLFQLTIPPKVTICRESIIMLIEGKCNLVTRATLHNRYEFKVVKSLPVRQVTNPSPMTRLLGLLRGLH